MRIKPNLIRVKGGTPLTEKIRVARQVFSNWPVVALDRTGLQSEVFYRTRDGYRFLCRGNTSDAGVVGAVFSGREYARELLELPKPGLTVLDVGANIGAFSVYLSSINTGVPFALYAFEPFADNFEMLRINCALNGVSPRELVKAAVTNVDGQVSLDASLEMGEVTVATDLTSGEKVDAVRLSTFCKERSIDQVHLLKMDIEGSEYAVFDADKDFICSRVDNIVMEYHKDSNGKGLDRIKAVLQPAFSINELVETPRTGVIHAKRK